MKKLKASLFRGYAHRSHRSKRGKKKDKPGLRKLFLRYKRRKEELNLEALKDKDLTGS